MKQRSTSAAIHLNKVINMAQLTAGKVLCFVSLDKKSERLAGFADASFASNPDLSSHLGSIPALTSCH